MGQIVRYVLNTISLFCIIVLGLFGFELLGLGVFAASWNGDSTLFWKILGGFAVFSLVNLSMAFVLKPHLKSPNVQTIGLVFLCSQACLVAFLTPLGGLVNLQFNQFYEDIKRERSFSQRDQDKTPEQKYQIAKAILTANPNGFNYYTEPDGKHAFALLKQASDAGYVPAKYSLAMMYGNAWAIDIDGSQRRSHLEDAAKAGSREARARLVLDDWYSMDNKKSNDILAINRFRSVDPDVVYDLAVVDKLNFCTHEQEDFQHKNIVRLMRLLSEAGSKKAQQRQMELIGSGECDTAK